MRSSTRIRLIEPTDAAPIAAHRVRDIEAFRPWEPAQPADFFTPEGQAERIDSLLAGYRAGAVWPGVVLADDQVTDELRLHRAEASTNLENLPSQRVLRRNGFSPYGVAHSSILLDGSWRDGLLWERILGDERGKA